MELSQRVYLGVASLSRVTRDPTRAPSFRCASSSCTSTLSGAMMSSASRKQRKSPRLCSMATLRPFPHPPAGAPGLDSVIRSSISRFFSKGRHSSRMSREESVLPSSYTHSSKGPGYVWSKTDWRTSGRKDSAFLIGMMNDTHANSRDSMIFTRNSRGLKNHAKSYVVFRVHIVEVAAVTCAGIRSVRQKCRVLGSVISGWTRLWTCVRSKCTALPV
mmetsp:Transcript_34314/g.65549  ORF Transcript_34314/g.65549 Transcript_34314/m.65549 type:complete len:217 (+) Transcript_34314:805-1455(+)